MIKDDFSIEDLTKQIQNDNIDKRNASFGIQMIRRALKDAVDEGRATHGASDKYYAEKAVEAREWIRNPTLGVPSLQQCCDAIDGTIGPQIVNEALDVLLENHTHPLEEDMGEALQEMTEVLREQESKEEVDVIISTVASHFGVSRSGLTNSNPQGFDNLDLTYPRHVGRYMVYKWTDMTSPEVGEIFDVSGNSVRKSKQDVKDDNFDDLEAEIQSRLGERT